MTDTPNIIKTEIEKRKKTEKTKKEIRK